MSGFKRAWEIERDVPIPPRFPLTEIARRMKPSESVLFDKHDEAQVFARALRSLGGKTTTKKIAGQGWRVWRVA